jgi:hypothetical protein
MSICSLLKVDKAINLDNFFKPWIVNSENRGFGGDDKTPSTFLNGKDNGGGW